MRRRDQNLAAVAWVLVNGIPDGDRDQFRRRAMSLAPMLQGSGLAATAAFLRAKSVATLATELETHVLDTLGVSGDDRNNFIAWLGNLSASEYRRAGAAAREFATWVKRAAEALIPPTSAG